MSCSMDSPSPASSPRSVLEDIHSKILHRSGQLYHPMSSPIKRSKTEFNKRVKQGRESKFETKAWENRSKFKRLEYEKEVHQRRQNELDFLDATTDFDDLISEQDNLVNDLEQKGREKSESELQMELEEMIRLEQLELEQMVKSLHLSS